MPVLTGLLLAGLLILVGAFPGLAVAVGALLLAALGLALHGAVLLLAQPAIQILAGVAAAVWMYRNRRIA